MALDARPDLLLLICPHAGFTQQLQCASLVKREQRTNVVERRDHQAVVLPSPISSTRAPTSRPSSHSSSLASQEQEKDPSAASLHPIERCSPTHTPSEAPSHSTSPTHHPTPIPEQYPSPARAATSFPPRKAPNTSCHCIHFFALRLLVAGASVAVVLEAAGLKSATAVVPTSLIS